jgi:hypothetical protein
MHMAAMAPQGPDCYVSPLSAESEHFTDDPKAKMAMCTLHELDVSDVWKCVYMHQAQQLVPGEAALLADSDDQVPASVCVGLHGYGACR